MREIFIDPGRCLSCHSCELACAVAHSRSGSLEAAIGEQPPPRARLWVEPLNGGGVPIQCNQCADAPCVAVCVTGALTPDERRGTVGYQPPLCIACTLCGVACPFGLIVYDAGSRRMLKCDLCAGRAAPACVEACPTGALTFGDPVELQRGRRREILKRLQASSMLTGSRAGGR